MRDHPHYPAVPILERVYISKAVVIGETAQQAATRVTHAAIHLLQAQHHWRNRLPGRCEVPTHRYILLGYITELARDHQAAIAEPEVIFFRALEQAAVDRHQQIGGEHIPPAYRFLVLGHQALQGALCLNMLYG
ncbi:hypothetical protein FQZ97_1029380 [compost metagenome]